MSNRTLKSRYGEFAQKASEIAHRKSSKELAEYIEKNKKLFSIGRFYQDREYIVSVLHDYGVLDSKMASLIALQVFPVKEFNIMKMLVKNNYISPHVRNHYWIREVHYRYTFVRSLYPENDKQVQNLRTNLLNILDFYLEENIDFPDFVRMEDIL